MAAPTVVVASQGSGNSKAITTPTAGNLLVAFVSQTGTTSPTITDSAGGTYTMVPVNTLFSSSTNSMWAGYKVATGTETTISFTAGGAGGAIGLVCFEVSGAANPVIIEQSKVLNNGGFTQSSVTTAITTEQNDLILAAVCLTATQVPTVWSGTKVMTMVSTATTLVFGGYYRATTPLTAQTFTGQWTGARNNGNMVIAIRPPYIPVVNQGFLSLMK